VPCKVLFEEELGGLDGDFVEFAAAEEAERDIVADELADQEALKVAGVFEVYAG
jgi:hypothetical protein